MLLGRRVFRKGLKRDLQQILGLSDRSWVNFRKTNAQGGITALQTWCLASSQFPNFSIPSFSPPFAPDRSISTLSGPTRNQRVLDGGESSQVDPKGIPRWIPRDSQGIPAPEPSWDPWGDVVRKFRQIKNLPRIPTAYSWLFLVFPP